VNLGTDGQSSIRFAGQAMDDANYRLDGNDMTGVQNAAPKSALRLQVSTEAIQEFSVSSAMYAAKNGGSAGGQINVVSKSGTNKLHGSIFEYIGNSASSARVWAACRLALFLQPPSRLWCRKRFRSS
jgi:hypothetical protein